MDAILIAAGIVIVAFVGFGIALYHGLRTPTGADLSRDRAQALAKAIAIDLRDTHAETIAAGLEAGDLWARLEEPLAAARARWHARVPEVPISMLADTLVRIVADGRWDIGTPPLD